VDFPYFAISEDEINVKENISESFHRDFSASLQFPHIPHHLQILIRCQQGGRSWGYTGK
jgi:hypothetical protein